ncbi:phosphatase PAP2-related protein [Mucilaginibacter sp.]|uniref:phosphatase PAP2-related protein n=1 Tax=Mucilaginibacter sp. TaxID=1882438 RepID=UPI002CAA2F74|nr:phosphatase PAP2-related protein [Mucilaginibacter sp.]HTI61419.1 phosphatase PAP2-related protein [Mucilaginibacter sp.]
MARTIAITLRNNWKQTWSSSLQRTQIIIGSILMIIISCMLPTFFNLIQKRTGPVLNDWLLAAVPSHNVSWAIFTVIWGMGFYSLWRAVEKPTIYITYLWTFIFITMLRVLAISLIPLDPPKGLIVLTDPLTGVFYGQSTITKDLFFSGHTSILFLLVLCLERKWDKILAGVATFAVACLLVVQHVHYTIDIIAAPIIIYPVHRFIRYLLG